MQKVDFSLNSCYKRIMRHRGIKFGIFIPVGSTTVKYDCMLKVALLCVLFALCPKVQ